MQKRLCFENAKKTNGVPLSLFLKNYKPLNIFLAKFIFVVERFVGEVQVYLQPLCLIPRYFKFSRLVSTCLLNALVHLLCLKFKEMFGSKFYLRFSI